MQKNIFQHELRIRWRSVLSWTLGLLGLHLLYLPFYGTFADQAALINQMLANFPPEFLEAFGMSGVDLSTVLGFYSFIFAIAQLLLAIQAANYGVGLLSVEESEWTADFLMTKPVSRQKIWVSKVLATLTSLLVTDVALFVMVFGLIPLFDQGNSYDSALLTKLLLTVIPFQLFFFSLGLAISLLVRRVRNVTPYGLGLGFGTYVLNAFSGTLGESKLEWLTPFKHFDPAYLIQHNALDNRLWPISVLVIVSGLLFAYFRYLRRDIPAIS